MRNAGAVFFLIYLLASIAHAGQLGSTFGFRIDGFNFGRQWEPNSCRKPQPPTLFVSSRRDYDAATDELNTYADRVTNYSRCVKNEARSDIGKVERTIFESADELIRDAQSELDRLRANLVTRKPQQEAPSRRLVE